MRDRRIGTRDVRERFGSSRRRWSIFRRLPATQSTTSRECRRRREDASALIQKFGGIKQLYESLDRIEESGIRGAKKIGGLLAEHRAAVDLARKLVRIETDSR